MVNYENRYGDVFTFTKPEDGNVLWTGPFEIVREGSDFVDPSGGPYIKVGSMLSHIIYDTDFNVIVESFERIENGYILKVKEHIVDPETEKLMFEDRDIIGGII